MTLLDKWSIYAISSLHREVVFFFFKTVMQGLSELAFYYTAIKPLGPVVRKANTNLKFNVGQR